MKDFALAALEERGIRPETKGKLTVFRIQNPYASAVISPYGAHVLSYIPAGEKDVLWLSGESFFETGKPIRGGIPVCWPWFGPAGTPSHGIARISMWELDDARLEADNSTTLIFLLDKQDFCGLTARLTVNIGPTLSLSLRTRNTGHRFFNLSEALHSYFSVQDITKTSILGLDRDDLPKTERFFPGYQDNKLVFEQETDLVCSPGNKILVIEDAASGRKIRVERNGSASAVVWNPWIDKSKRMSDFGDEEYKTMVCVEAANAKENTLGLIPGATHTLQTRISVMH